MAKILVAFIIVGILRLSAFATGGSTQGTVQKIEVHNLTTTDHVSCSVGVFYVYINNTWWWHPVQGEDARALLSLFMTAQSTGREVSMAYTDQFPNCPPDSLKKILFATLIGG